MSLSENVEHQGCKAEHSALLPFPQHDSDVDTRRQPMGSNGCNERQNGGRKGERLRRRERIKRRRTKRRQRRTRRTGRPMEGEKSLALSRRLIAMSEPQALWSSVVHTSLSWSNWF